MEERRTALRAIGDQLEAMSSRDRNLLAGTAMFMAVVVVGLITWTLLGLLDNEAARVREAKENLAVIQLLKEDYLVEAARIEAAEAKLKEYGAQAVTAFVEQIALREGVAEGLTAVPEVSREVVGSIRTTGYKMELKKVSLQGAVGFLHSLETSEFPIRVKSATFKTVLVRREKLIDMNLELLAYSFEETE